MIYSLLSLLSIFGNAVLFLLPKCLGEVKKKEATLQEFILQLFHFQSLFALFVLL